ITILGAVLGLGVGAFFGWAAVSAMGSIGVDRLSLPAFRLIMFAVVAGVAGVVAAIFPARRAAKLDVLHAIAHEDRGLYAPRMLPARNVTPRRRPPPAITPVDASAPARAHQDARGPHGPRA